MTTHPPRFGPRLMVFVLALLTALLTACSASGGGPVKSGGISPNGSGTGMAESAVGAAATSAPALASAPAPIGGVAQNASNRQQQQSLRAGEIDDNADFATYQAYLSSYSQGGVHPVDVSERYIITVRDSKQQPVLGATFRIFAGEQQVFRATTTAGGKVIFFPRAAGVSDDLRELRMEASLGNQTASGSLQRGQNMTQELTLPGAIQATMPKLDVLFLLDTTGSMGDEITQVQQSIRSIADQVDALSPRPELRFGLVAYRDQGDEYVTRATDFTSDVAAFRQTLSRVQADGGGDDPEALTEALAAAVNDVTWAEGALRLTFLVADAPPHVTSQEQHSYVDSIRGAVAKGIKVYPIAASNTSKPAEYVFRQMAQQTLGRFIFLTYQQGQAAGTPGDTTTMNVDPAAFTAGRLDEIVVNAIKRELAEAAGG